MADDLSRHLRTITAAQRKSAHILTHFQTALDDIGVRAKRVTHDVTQYHVAWRNISATERELKVAQECYAIPSYVEDVVANGVREVPIMCKAMERLVKMKAYLDDKPSNRVGDRLNERVTEHLNKLVEIFERHILATVLDDVTLPKADHTTASAAKTTTHVAAPKLQKKTPPSWSECHHLIGLLLFHFRRSDVCSQLKAVLSESIVKYITDSVALANFDEDLASKANAASAASGSRMFDGLLQNFFSPEYSRRDRSRNATYQKGKQVMIMLSSHTRSLCSEAVKIIDGVVLRAAKHLKASIEREEKEGRIRAEEDSDSENLSLQSVIENVSLIPSEIVLAIADRLFEESVEALERNARNPDCSLHAEIFFALDLLEELWQWRALARQIPGEKDGLIWSLDELVNNFAAEVNGLLLDYKASKGEVEAAELHQAVVSNRIAYERCSTGFLMLLGIHTADPEFYEALSAHRSLMVRKWMPQLDASVHESTASLINFMAQMLSPSFEACLRVALLGSTKEVDRILRRGAAGPIKIDEDEEALWQEEIKEFLTSIVQGHCFDLESIGKATGKLVNLGEMRNARVRGSDSDDAPEEEEDTIGDNEKCSLVNGPGQQRFNAAVFLANNAQCMISAFRSNVAFTRSARNSDIATALTDICEEVLADAVETFGKRWSGILPPYPIFTMGEEELTKEERMKAKLWHRDACLAIEAEFASLQEQYVDPMLRLILSQSATEAVKEVFADAGDQINERRWSDTPEKWMTIDLDGLESRFVRVFAGR